MLERIINTRFGETPEAWVRPSQSQRHWSWNVRSWSAPLLSISLIASGCTSGIVSRAAIEDFAASVAAKDIKDIKEHSSTDFERKALRTDDAIQDLRILNLPTGKTTVLSVDDISPTVKMVHVEIGEKAGGDKLDFRLVKDEKSRKWVVDDVVRPSASGSEVAKSAAAQMDLLLTVREFLDAWRSKKGERVLAVTTPELRGLLNDVPQNWLTQMAEHMVAEVPQRNFRPDARMENNRAVVKAGGLLVELQHIDNHWLVSDASLEAKEDTVRSVRKLAAALTQSRRFLDAYAAGDMPALQAVATPEFHDKCLVAADLKSVPMPARELLDAPYEARQQKLHTDILLESGDTTYMLSLALEKGDGVPGKAQEVVPHVEEVTIYEAGETEVKRLSAIFLTQATVHLFADVLNARDRARLEQLSTADFSRRVWRRTNNDVLSALPIPEIEPVDPEVVATVYNGEITEVTVSQGSRALVYVMRMVEGEMLVDDILMPVMDRPTSFKANMEQIIPIYEFALAAHTADREKLIATSAEGLDRIVWKQLKENPDLVALTGYHLPRWMAMPVQKIDVNGQWATVQLGNGEQQSEIRLTREGDRFLVHDVTLIAGPADDERVELMTTMRRLMANSMNTPGRLSPYIAAQEMPKNNTSVVPASGEMPSGSSSEIQHAVFEKIEIE